MRDVQGKLGGMQSKQPRQVQLLPFSGVLETIDLVACQLLALNGDGLRIYDLMKKKNTGKFYLMIKAVTAPLFTPNLCFKVLSQLSGASGSPGEPL